MNVTEKCTENENSFFKCPVIGKWTENEHCEEKVWWLGNELRMVDNIQITVRLLGNELRMITFK